MGDTFSHRDGEESEGGCPPRRSGEAASPLSSRAEFAQSRDQREAILLILRNAPCKGPSARLGCSRWQFSCSFTFPLQSGAQAANRPPTTKRPSSPADTRG